MVVRVAQRRSHVHGVVTAAMRGDFGEVAPHVWLSPLLSLFWFFSLPVVTGTHCFLDSLRETDTIWDVSARIEGARQAMQLRERSRIPI